MNSVEYLALAKEHLNIKSDYALAQRLDVTRQMISKLQSGKIVLSDEMAVKIAMIVDKHPAIVLADVHAEREKNPEIQAIWRGLVEKISLGFDVLTLCVAPRRISL